jgi:hypothetical protein
MLGSVHSLHLVHSVHSLHLVRLVHSLLCRCWGQCIPCVITSCACTAGDSHVEGAGGLHQGHHPPPATHLCIPWLTNHTYNYALQQTHLLRHGPHPHPYCGSPEIRTASAHALFVAPLKFAPLVHMHASIVDPLKFAPLVHMHASIVDPLKFAPLVHMHASIVDPLKCSHACRVSARSVQSLCQHLWALHTRVSSPVSRPQRVET